MLRAALASLVLTLAVTPGEADAQAETIRIATYNTGLSQSGPGVLLHELGKEKLDPDVVAALAAIRAARPDVILLCDFDHDMRGRALEAFVARLAEGPDGIDYPHSFHAPVNAGAPSGRDLDGDTMVMGRADAFGWGAFAGDGGMAILSKLPIDAEAARTFLTLPWTALPGALLPERPDGAPWPDAETQAAFRLSSRSHWDVPVILPGGGRLHLLASNPTPPLFDGPEKLNERRNHDEIGFWTAYLDGVAFPDDAGAVAAAPDAPLVVLGDLNADPADGAGLRAGIARLLAHPRLVDPRPASAGAARAARAQGGANARHAGPPERDTADWGDDGPGNLRVDYVLPSRELRVEAAGVVWPEPGAALAEIIAAGAPHRLVWVDVTPPQTTAASSE